MVKKKKVEGMKTSEIMDELGKDSDDDRFTELDNELDKKTPFNYIYERIKELEEKNEFLENNFEKHHHLKGKLVKEI